VRSVRYWRRDETQRSRSPLHIPAWRRGFIGGGGTRLLRILAHPHLPRSAGLGVAIRQRSVITPRTPQEEGRHAATVCGNAAERDSRRRADTTPHSPVPCRVLQPACEAEIEVEVEQRIGTEAAIFTAPAQSREQLSLKSYACVCASAPAEFCFSNQGHGIS
jgi:hypothetical protein